MITLEEHGLWPKCLQRKHQIDNLSRGGASIDVVPDENDAVSIVYFFFLLEELYESPGLINISVNVTDSKDSARRVWYDPKTNMP